MLDGWVLERPVRAGTVLAALILTYFVSWCGISFLRHYHFYSSYDLATQDQVVWNTAQGRPFSRSIEVTNDLGDHVRPYLAILSLFYLLVPSAYVLLTFQSLVLSLGAFPLYSLARRKFDSPVMGLAAAFCFLAYPPIGFLNRFDFHAEVLAIPLLIAAYERIDIDDLRSASLLMALSLFTKENLGVTVAMLGIIAGYYYKHWRFGLIWAVVGIVYSLVAMLVVIPAFRGEPSDTLTRYYWLGDSPSKMLWTMMSQPIFVLRKIFGIEHIITLFQLLAPVAFLPLLGLPQLLLAVPTLIYNFLAEWPSQTTIYTHYMALVIPSILISTIFGLQRLQRFVKNPRPEAVKNIIRRYGIRSGAANGFCASIILIATLTSWIYENPIMGNASLEWRSGTMPRLVPGGIKSAVPMILPNDSAIREGLSYVPRRASVLTTEHYAPHLSHRAWIQIIPKPPTATLAPDAEAIFLNLKDSRFFTFWRCEDFFETLKAAARANFGMVFYRDGVLLVQKDMGDKTKLQTLVDHWPSCQ